MGIKGEVCVKLVDRAISSVASKPASESPVFLSGLSRVHGLRATAKMKPVTWHIHTAQEINFST